MRSHRPNSNKERIRVLFIAKHQMVQESFKLLIESSSDFIVTETISFENSVDRISTVPMPDVAVIYLAGDERVEIISDLLEILPDLRIVVTVASGDLELQARALELGAVGIVHEEQSSGLLIEAIKQTYSGETWLNQVLLNKLLQRKKSADKADGKRGSKIDPDSGIETLTSRELEVLTLIGAGLKNKQIAQQLLISEPTVRSHLSAIFGKFGVDDRLNLVIKAYRSGLLEVSSTIAAPYFESGDTDQI